MNAFSYASFGNLPSETCIIDGYSGEASVAEMDQDEQVVRLLEEDNARDKLSEAVYSLLTDVVLDNSNHKQSRDY